MRSLIIPMVMVILAAIIAYAYVLPEAQKIQQTQNETAEYEKAVSEIAQKQTLLAELRKKQSTFSVAELQNIEALLPETINEGELLANVERIVLDRGVLLESIAVVDAGARLVAGDDTSEEVDVRSADPFDVADGFSSSVPGDQVGENNVDVNSKRVTVSVIASYDRMVTLLKDFERNLQLIEVTAVNFSTAAGEDEDSSSDSNALISATIELELYSIQ